MQPVQIFSMNLPFILCVSAMYGVFSLQPLTEQLFKQHRKFIKKIGIGVYMLKQIIYCVYKIRIQLALVHTVLILWLFFFIFNIPSNRVFTNHLTLHYHQKIIRCLLRLK